MGAARGHGAGVACEAQENGLVQAMRRAEVMRRAAEKTTGEVLPVHSHPDAGIRHQTQQARVGRNGVSRDTQQKLDALARRAGETPMTKVDFLASIEEELRLRGIAFERSALVEYIASMWPWIDRDPDVYRWAGEFMKIYSACDMPWSSLYAGGD
jgi:hypothetical protein